MAEYIEREAFRKQLIDRQITTAFFNQPQRHEIGCIVEMLDNTPTADVVEVRHGEWMVAYRGRSATVYECSECGHLEFGTSDYCVCGAKMDGKGEGE